MNWNIILKDTAKSEIDESFLYYEIQLQNLGNQFAQSVSESFDKIQSNPFSFPVVYRDIRRSIVKRFPFVIYFSIDISTNEITIISVFHTSRNSANWQNL